MGGDKKTFSDDPYGLRPMWDSILSIYDAFADICKRHKLKYYIGWGTALGAVRHNGFIPWDDDFDVLMPRDDYTKFCEIAKDVLPGHLKLVYWKNTSEFFPNVFCKVQDSRQDTVESVEKKLGRKLPHGIYIDIFPLDGSPEGIVEKAWYWINLLVLLSSGSSFYGVKESPSLVKLIWRSIGWIFARIVYRTNCRQEVYKRYDELSRRFAYCKDRKCGCILVPARMPLSCLWDYSVFGEPSWFSFSGRKVPLPCDYHSFLKQLYGDYMTLPPKDLQHPPHGSLDEAPWRFGPTN